MSKKVLAVFASETTLEFLKIDQTLRSSKLKDPIFTISRDEAGSDRTVRGLWRWADEIHFISAYPTVLYNWAPFPKVANWNLKRLVHRRVSQEIPGSDGQVRSAFVVRGEVVVEGTSQRQVAYVGVSEPDVAALEEMVPARHQIKISRVTTLALSLAAAVARGRESEDDFLILWSHGDATIIIACDAQGDIRIARYLPFGIGSEEMLDDAVRMERFSEEIGRDLNGTLFYYSQQFPDKECQELYILGSPALQEVFTRFPLAVGGDRARYGTPRSLAVNLDEVASGEYAHLLGVLHVDASYNLVNTRFVYTRQFYGVHRIVMAILLACIAGAGIWAYQLDPLSSGKLEEFHGKRRRLEQQYARIYDLQRDLYVLKQFRGWKDYYDRTFKHQPDWNGMFSAMVACVPEGMVIDSLRIVPGRQQNRHVWRCLVDGHLDVQTWQEGLDLLRYFGGRINSTPYYQYEKVSYTPESEIEQDEDLTQFTFQFTLLLEPKGVEP